MPKSLFIVTIILLAALGGTVRIGDLFPVFVQDGDVGVAGLVALHIYEGKDFPIYTPMGHYGGTLVNYIQALFFGVFGVSAFALRLTGVLFSCVWGLMVFLLARRVAGLRGAVLALVFWAIPAYAGLTFSLDVTGVYSSAFILIPFLLFLFSRWLEEGGGASRFTWILGFCSGLGLWLTPWIFPVLLTMFTVALIFKVRPGRKACLGLALGFCLGYLPAIIYEVQHPGAQLLRFGGRVLDIDRGALSSPGFWRVLAGQIAWRLSTIPAALARVFALFVSSAGWMSLAVFCGGLGMGVYEWRRRATDPVAGRLMVVLTIFVVWYAVFYAAFIGDPFIRYAAPLLCLFPVVAGYFCARFSKEKKGWCAALIVLLVMYHAVAMGRALSSRYVRGYKALGSWMISQGHLYGYADFDTAYPVTFEAREKVLISPTLFHPSYSDRWPSETARVRGSEDAVFIVDAYLRPAAAAALERGLEAMGVLYKKDRVEEFVVYSGFSRKVFPEELCFPGERV